MARDEMVEQRLQRWADWLRVGDGSGYPTMSVLHHEWSPPAGGLLPTLKVGQASDVHETHRAIGRLSVRLQDTLVLTYLYTSLTVADRAARLQCGERTVQERIEIAHRLLRPMLERRSFCKPHEVG